MGAAAPARGVESAHPEAKPAPVERYNDLQGTWNGPTVRVRAKETPRS